MFELLIRSPEDAVEPISDQLEALDALSVSIEDAQAETEQEQALFGEPGMPAPRQAWQDSIIKALFASEAQAQVALAMLQAHSFFANAQVEGIVALPEQDWVQLTQSQFAPVAITADFWIVPSWHDVPANAKVVIELDPGLAFGTGTHPTTQMCLRWIAQNPERLRGKRVLDYGCGSGILAIAAAKYGAAQVVAVDIDPAAVTASQYNAEKNQVQMQIGLPELAVGKFDVVLANILASPLKVLAPLLCEHVQADGSLVLAGILDRQEAELIAAYQTWLPMEVADSQEGWILLSAASTNRSST